MAECDRLETCCGSEACANVHSFQSLGAVDGPGLRYIIFLQGCPYHCPYCHNPDTRVDMGGTVYTVTALADRLERYRPYFSSDGGVTLSGGEPLMQGEFVEAFFRECHARGIHTCLDTAAVEPDDLVCRILADTDCVLCDIKSHDPAVCREVFGVSLESTLRFLAACDAAGCDIVIRHVVVPGMTTKETVRRIVEMTCGFSHLKKIELLPFRKLCVEKYQKLGWSFPFADVEECSQELLNTRKQDLQEVLSDHRLVLSM